VLEQTNNRPADQLSAPNEAAKAAFEHLQRQSEEKDKTSNKTMALELKTLTKTAEELKTDMRSILDLLQQNNNNNNPPAANPSLVAGVEQEEPAAAGK
jgi:hypothetical protein